MPFAGSGEYPMRILFTNKRGAQNFRSPISHKVTLRDEIDRIIVSRESLHPAITGELSGALRELASTANELADSLNGPTKAPDPEVKRRPTVPDWKEAYRNEAYLSHRELKLLERIRAYEVEDQAA